MRPWFVRNTPAIGLFLLTLLAWQAAVTFLKLREYLLPSPASVLRALSGTEIPWAGHVWITTVEIVGAFVVAAVVGIALGIAIAWSPVLARALVPFLVFVNTLPKVAVAPLFLLWLGYGIVPNMLIGALIGFFPVVINTAVGLTQVDDELLDLGRVFSAPKWKVFVKIRIPNAYPYILSALKVTATAAVVGAVVGEFVASQKGLGYVIITTQGSMNTPVAFAALVWISVIGLAVYGAVVVAARWIAPGRTRRDRQGEIGMKRLIIIVALLAAALAAGPSAPPSAQPMQKVTFALNWFAVGDHAAYWVALDKGYYKAKGLEVELQNSKGSGDSIAKVDTGRADVGLADSAVVIASVGRGTKIKVVGMVFDKSPLNIWSRREAPITQPKQLEGKTIGAPPGDGQRQVFPAFAKLHGIDQSKVTWVNIEPAAKVAAIAEKRVDSVADYTTGLPFYEKAMGKGNAVMMPWADHGFDMYSMSIMASEKTMKDNPAMLRAFLEASYMGWRDVMDNPKSALEIFKKRVPEIDLSIIEPNMMMGLELMKTERYAKNGIGWMEDKKMCASVDLVNTYMGVPKKVECKDVYTNEFLTRIELPKSMR